MTREPPSKKIRQKPCPCQPPSRVAVEGPRFSALLTNESSPFATPLVGVNGDGWVKQISFQTYSNS
jgi:hypothetical protein